MSRHVGDAALISRCEIEAAFDRYSRCGKIDAFGVKCTILHLYAEEIGTVSLLVNLRAGVGTVSTKP